MNTSYKNLLSRLWLTLLLLGTLSACSTRTFDYDHPDVSLFVEQLKHGTLPAHPSDSTNQIPRFSVDDIEPLLRYADDLTAISSFPLAPISYSPGGKLRLGECILWTIESIRLGYPASMGCKMVYSDADNYEGIYFLSDDEVSDAAARYRRWWENRRYPPTDWTIMPCYDEPLCGSGYMWW